MKRVSPRVYTTKYYLTDCGGYREFKQSFGKILEPRLKVISKIIPLKKGMRVLDIGCGRGELSLWAARRGARVTGIDYSENAIRLAALAARKTSCRQAVFQKMDALHLKFKNGSFGAVILIEIAEHLYSEELRKVLKEAARVLTARGFIFLHTEPNKWFNDIAYRFWCYPASLLFGEKGKLLHWSKIRSDSHKKMHVNESTYFYLKRLFKDAGLRSKIGTTNIVRCRPIIGWKDKIYNLVVFLDPLSRFFPLNTLFGQDFYAILEK